MSASPPQLSPSRASAIMNMRRAEEGDYVLTCLLAGSCHWPSSSLFNLLLGEVSVILLVKANPLTLRNMHPHMIIPTKYRHCGLYYAGVEVWNRCSPPLPLLRSCSTFFSTRPPPFSSCGFHLGDVMWIGTKTFQRVFPLYVLSPCKVGDKRLIKW